MLLRTSNILSAAARRVTGLYSTNTSLPAAWSNVNVMFGSQTGTARMFAKSLVSSVGDTLQKPSKLVDLAEFDPAILQKDSLNVFVVASFGEGQPTDNAKRFYQWLSGNNEEVSSVVRDMPFAVFGCGQSCTYPDRYQAFPKYVELRLRELGAREVVARGEGDDSKDIEEDYDKWFASVLKPVIIDPKAAQEVNVAASESSSAGVCSFLAQKAKPLVATAVTDEEMRSKTDALKQATKAALHSWYEPYLAPISVHRELTAAGHQMRSAVHIEFDLSGAAQGRMDYTTGDYLGIIPSNLKAVDTILERLRLSGEQTFQKSDPIFEAVPRLPDSFTLREALTHYFDIRSPPKRAVIRTLAEFANSPFERRTLMHLGSQTDDPEEAAFYQQYIVRDNRGIASLLRDFPSVAIPASTLLSRLSPLQPRFYSIANASQPTMASVCASLLFGPAPDGRPWYGTTSYYLKNSKVGDRVPIFISSSSVRPPADQSAPLIMVAGGTGISLARSFWQERVRAQAKGRMMLFYGCNATTDTLYLDETSTIDMQRFNALTFDQSEPTFAQYRFQQQGRSLVDMIVSENASLYVCGHKALGKAIRDALMTMLRKHGGMHYREAGEYVRHLQEAGRYVDEIFQ